MAPSATPRKEAHDGEAAAWFYRHGGDGFALVKDKRLVSVNPAWCAIMDTTPAAAMGQRVSELIHPDDTDAYFETVFHLERDGEADFDVRLITGAGRAIWVRAAVKQGRDGVSMIVLKDVTAERQQRIEAELAAKSIEMLRASAGVHLWKFDPDTGRYTVESAMVSPGRGGLANGTKDISTGQMDDNIHSDDRAGFAAAFIPSVRSGEAGQHICRYRVVKPDGSETWARYRTAWRGVRQCAGGKWELRGLTQDITELSEARDAALRGEQAAKDAAETKARFLANMSHEIRTPLNGVLGVLHLLKNDTLSSDGQQLVDQALACGAMLTQLLNDVLDFSKIEAGKLELNPEPLDPAAALIGVADMLRPQTDAKGLYLRTVITGSPGWVSADPVRLRQALFNLIGNAVKFTLRGGVEVRMISLGAGAEHRLRVEVQDTGVGIAPEAMAALFERFHQVDGSTTRRFGGTGLGLAITRSLVEQMGGEVHATSKIGEGSTFWFEIAAATVESMVCEEADDVAWLEGLRIMVVEDNPTNRLIAGRMLQSLGASIETADNGAEGVEAASRQAFDLIFMDIQMPVMDGIEATRRIRALPGSAARTPIVAMTANVFAHQVKEYLAAGMDGAVGKPLSPADILAELARLMGQGQERVAAA